MAVKDKLSWINEEDGALHCDFRSVSDKKYFKITPWSKGLELFIRVDGQWKRDNTLPIPHLFVNAAKSNRSQTPISQFIKEIPTDIFNQSQTILPYMIEVCHLCRVTPYTLDLLSSNPALLAVVIHDSFNEWSDEKWKKIMGYKQHKMLQELQYDATPAAARFLAKFKIKITKSSHYRHIIIFLHLFLKNEGGFPHLYVSEINQTLFENFQFNAFNMIFPAIQHECSKHRFESYEIELMLNIWLNTIGLAGELHICHPKKTLTRATNMKQLRKIHDRWSKRARQKE